MTVCLNRVSESIQHMFRIGKPRGEGYRKHGKHFKNRYTFDKFWNKTVVGVVPYVDDIEIHNHLQDAYSRGQTVTSMLTDGVQMVEGGKTVDISKMGYTRYIIRNKCGIDFSVSNNPTELVINMIRKTANNGVYTRKDLWNAKKQVFGLKNGEIDITRYYTTAINRKLRDAGLVLDDGCPAEVCNLSDIAHTMVVEMNRLFYENGVDMDEIYFSLYKDPSNMSRHKSVADMVSERRYSLADLFSAQQSKSDSTFFNEFEVIMNKIKNSKLNVIKTDIKPPQMMGSIEQSDVG